jgi:transcriptional regulator with XRE-family HTH domain
MPRLKQVTGEIDRQIGQTIRQIRLARGISQEKFAEQIGVTFQQIQKYENGNNRLSVSALVLICKAFAVNPMDIIGPLVGEKSDLNGLVQQINLLKQQLADIKSAIKAAAR